MSPIASDNQLASGQTIQVIGIGDDGLDGLTPHAIARLEKADLLIGPPSLIDKCHRFQAKKEAIGADLERMLRLIQQDSSRSIVILASGDPLFYGTARYLCDRLGKDRFEVVPHVSSMQLAFARVKESWDEAYLTNLATQSFDRFAERVRSAEKVGIFTTESISPGRVAQGLLERGFDYFSAYVCENLGSPDERVTRGSLQEIAIQTFSNLNVMILVRQPGVPDRAAGPTGKRLFGNPDEWFLQSKPKRGLLTPSEVRSIALAEMQLTSTSIAWDVGAGSGSVAIEAAQIAGSGMIYAIEMDAEDYSILVENTKRFGVSNLKPILGEAPYAWKDLPDPDAIFVGGTGRSVTELIHSAWQRLRVGGCLLAHVASLENVAALQTMLHDQMHLEPMVWMLQFSRANYQLGRSRLEAINPTFLIKACKSES